MTPKYKDLYTMRPNDEIVGVVYTAADEQRINDAFYSHTRVRVPPPQPIGYLINEPEPPTLLEELEEWDRLDPANEDPDQKNLKQQIKDLREENKHIRTLRNTYVELFDSAEKEVDELKRALAQEEDE